MILLHLLKARPCNTAKFVDCHANVKIKSLAQAIMQQIVTIDKSGLVKATSRILLRIVQANRQSMTCAEARG